VEAVLQQLAAGPTALFGGEQAALELLSGPPARGPPGAGADFRGQELLAAL